jgi:hypothetical protein
VTETPRTPSGKTSTRTLGMIVALLALLGLGMVGSAFEGATARALTIGLALVMVGALVAVLRSSQRRTGDGPDPRR